MEEQKAFEIKDPSEICSDLFSRGIEFDAHDDFWDYQRAANAEILRHKSVVKQLMSNIDFHVETINSLKSEIDNKAADAPTWGEWVEREVVIDGKIYEVEFTNGSTQLVDNEELRDLLPQNQYNDNKVTRFRRLNYEPKPAREVEKFSDETLAKIADPQSTFVQLERDLARSLILSRKKHAAAQAELRELKGASDAESK